MGNNKQHPSHQAQEPQGALAEPVTRHEVHILRAGSSDRPVLVAYRPRKKPSRAFAREVEQLEAPSSATVRRAPWFLLSRFN
jgi:hypothetical protein